jgi:hypothetical protein
MTISEEDYVREHAAMLGRVTLAWNDCHYAVFHIFHDLSGMTWERSQAVFFSLKVDRAQRQATIALMKEVLSSDNDRGMFETGKNLLNKLDSLADERNLATHTMWDVLMPERKITPHPHTRHHSLLKKDFIAQFEGLTTKLADLTVDLFQFGDCLHVHLTSIAERAAREQQLNEPDLTHS